jgi:hypothetical protein
MTLAELLSEVETRTYEALPAALLRAGVKQHMDHGFRTGCECFYCQEKRFISRWGFWNVEKQRFARERLRYAAIGIRYSRQEGGSAT